MQALLWCLSGGADTFGGKVPDPFSATLEREIGMPILNLGVQHSGAGFYIEDDVIHEIIENAQVIFIEAPSVVNQSNPFYRVHPRRNDRFVTALGPLYDLFPVADLIGFYPELHNAVSQVQDQVVSIQLAMSHMPASQRDHQQIGLRLLDAIA